MQEHNFEPWWRQPGRVEHLAAGVFEGGGAKGIAYGGALEAVLDAGCWFEAVAGASAGAITALLVAAGLDPKQIQAVTVQALATVDVGGLGSLTKGLGYYPKERLGALLAGVVAGSRPGSAEPGATEVEAGLAVTFAELFQRTGIELDVVCADISRHNLVVFSPHDTPGCQVVEAVLVRSK